MGFTVGGKRAISRMEGFMDVSFFDQNIESPE